ncbi:Lactoylglutathione lyase / glyoxalase I family protein [Cucumis melo var. makuwa]|uniref:Lactoylglutathione lyase / glyoxalase I family protein n=1 Tax=Cucumis melo var. makuwa TaxID=1194695 RepID=A0A5D3CFQ6_CUCMM|nr:Lactoylglutathione lyase / glyoxalase I family protein [Cucumis melo var. makuwa]TYK10058.1 Lactoylglutathione lyase / glyoxalase I family protein [Cucumis melo var. makuwa]
MWLSFHRVPKRSTNAHFIDKIKRGKADLLFEVFLELGCVPFGRKFVKTIAISLRFRVGGCGYHGICFTTRAKGGVEQDVLEKSKEPIEIDVENGNLHVLNMFLVASQMHIMERLAFTTLEYSARIWRGLQINEARPHDKLPYRGAWLWVGAEMIHLMELPNPDPLSGRPEHGGRDRHTCIGIRDVSKLKAILDKAGIPYTLSKSGRPAIFTRDPDANALEFTQVDG